MRPVIAEGLFSYQIGGSERVGVDVATEFARRGYDVVCFAFYDSDGPMRAELESKGIRCVNLNYETYRGALKRPAYQMEFWRMLRRERVQALHVHHATALILCAIPALLAGVKHIVMTEHGLHQLKERPAYRRSASFYCRFASDITVVEPTQAQYFRTELSVPLRKIHYIPNGVSTSVRTSAGVANARRTLGLDDNLFAFFNVGRMNPVKDLGTLLTAFSLLPSETRGRSRLFMVGDGPDRGMLEARRDSLGLHDHVKFLGARNDVANLLIAADAFVMSSRTEGLPMALLEAMASGVPCVATEVGGIPELLGDQRGLLVPPGDPERLAEAMTSITRSENLRAQLSSKALERVRASYALAPVVDKYLRLLGLPPRLV
jgi:glycosyltransferase involved in cell wall biosynthesis